MKLVANWRRVLTRAWSVRLALIGAGLNGLYVTASIVAGGLDAPPLWLAVGNGVLAVSVSIVRIIDQKNMED